MQDAFQAVFLVLVQKARSLWVQDSLGPWLHGVALRVQPPLGIRRSDGGFTSGGTPNWRREPSRIVARKATIWARWSTKKSAGCQRPIAPRWSSATWRV